MIMMLISIELILNSVDMNFAVFNRYLYPGGEMEGGLFFLHFLLLLCRPAKPLSPLPS